MRPISDGVIHGVKKRILQVMGILCTLMFFILYKTTKCQYQHTKIETVLRPFDSIMLPESQETDFKVDYLPRGIIEASSDLELKHLWLTRGAKLKQQRLENEFHVFTEFTTMKDDVLSHQNLFAIPAGIKQKKNVDAIVQKFFSENFTVILFHYDGNVDGWHDLQWSNKVLHIVAWNQTKWWFAKRFLHPDVVSAYDYIFIWDEDLGVENFHPQRYLKIMRSEGLEISQPALDPNSSEIHHKITVRKERKKVHRRIYLKRGRVRCSEDSSEPPCTGWVEGMAPVFSRAAWRCAWHLIQNDLIHGWGMDMKLGYCSQGDRTKKVGIIDSEFVVHQGIQTLQGSSREKIRRRAAYELEIFRQRWDRAARDDKGWLEQFGGHIERRRSQRKENGRH